MRINKKQSTHIDKIRLRATRQFVKLKVRQKRKEDGLLKEIDRHSSAYKDSLSKYLGIHPIQDISRLMREADTGPSTATSKSASRHSRKYREELYRKIVATVENLKDASIRFGMYHQTLRTYKGLQQLWQLGVINKAEYIIQHLRLTNKPIDDEAVMMSLEFMDLLFGVDELDGTIRFGAGIPDATKRNYRSTLKKRTDDRKMKKK